MFPMTVTIHNQTQLSALLAAMGDTQVGTEPIVTEKPEAKKAEVEKEAKKATPESTPAATPEPTASPELTQATAAEAVQLLDGHATRPADAPTYQDAAAAVTKLSKASGRDAAVALLAEFGAAKLPEVKPEDFAALIAKVNKQSEA